MNEMQLFRNFNLGTEISIAGSFAYNAISNLNSSQNISEDDQIFLFLYNAAASIERMQKCVWDITASGKYSKYALTQVLKCAECSGRYRRCTWTSHGQRQIVWRCIRRLDYGRKYCSDSITVFERALQAAIIRALKHFNSENKSTYLTLMKASIGNTIGINGGSDEIDLLSRRIDALSRKMINMVNETIQSGLDIDSNEDESNHMVSNR